MEKKMIEIKNKIVLFWLIMLHLVVILIGFSIMLLNNRISMIEPIDVTVEICPQIEKKDKLNIDYDELEQKVKYAISIKDNRR